MSKKRRGPAPTGVGEPQLVRMHARQLEQIDLWAAAQSEKMTRPEAIRRLVERGLEQVAIKADYIRNDGCSWRIHRA
jgi:hypothetical protein